MSPLYLILWRGDMNFSAYREQLSQLTGIIKPDPSRPVESHLIFCPDFIMAISYNPSSSGYVIAKLNLRKKDKVVYDSEFQITNLNKAFGIPVDVKAFLKSGKNLDISVKGDKAIINAGRSKSTVLTVPMEDLHMPECASEEYWPSHYQLMDGKLPHEIFAAMKVKQAIEGPIILSHYIFSDEGYVYSMNNTRAIEVDFGEDAPKGFAVHTKTTSFFKLFQPSHFALQDGFAFWKNKQTGIEFCMPHQSANMDSFSPQEFFEVELQDCHVHSKATFPMDNFTEAIKDSQSFARSSIDAEKFSVCLTVGKDQIQVFSNNEKGETTTTVHGGLHCDEEITVYANPQDLMEAMDGAAHFGLVKNEDSHSYMIFFFEDDKEWLRQFVFIQIGE